jgi:hypothetical protein
MKINENGGIVSDNPKLPMYPSQNGAVHESDRADDHLRINADGSILVKKAETSRSN